MLKLIQLELRRNKLKTYLLASLIILLSGFALSFLFAYIPELEAANPVTGKIQQSAMDLVNFRMDWKTLLTIIPVLYMMCFAVLSSVMHTKISIEEYTGKRAVLLFSYPVKRSRVLFAKCFLVFVFTSLGMIVCSIISILLFGLISNLAGIMPEPFTAAEVLSGISNSVILGLTAGSMGLVALRVGFWKRSMIATIITAVILCTPCSNLFMLAGDQSLPVMIGFAAVLIAAGLVIFVLLSKKVDKMEAL